MTEIERALALISALDGVQYIEVSGRLVYVYVNDVSSMFGPVTAIFNSYAPHIKGQLRGPSYPTRPPKASAPQLAM